jgi:sugar-specific transcriptional regulator TrmB
MDEKEVLKELGLSDGETKVYLALLKLGPSTVNKITKITEQHRTTIYDFLEKLLNKGLVNYVIKNNVKYYKATHPNKLMDLLKEKEDNLKNIMPSLIDLSKFQKEEVKVEVYKGKEGLKTVMLDVIRSGKEIVCEM